MSKTIDINPSKNPEVGTIYVNDLFNKFIREELPSDLRERFINDFNKNYNNFKH